MTAVPVLTREELRAVEARAIAASTTSLMELAGQAVAESARRLALDTGAPILIVAGPGNNGGDAWVAAAHLVETFHRVLVLDVAGAEPKAPEARAAKSAYQARGGRIASEWSEGAAPALVVDGLLGIGLARDVEAGDAELIAKINACGAPVLAIDIPSGLDAHTGSIRGAAVVADETLTFIAHKVGLHTGDGPDCCGRVALASLGCDAWAREAARGTLLSPDAVASWLPARRRNSHKGDFGTLAVVGGNRGMVGAALLAARAGILAGAGKVVAALLASDGPGADLVHPELMLRSVDDALRMADVIVAGPGAGRSPSATSVSMFERATLPALIASAKPLVLDADALNAIACNEALQKDLADRKAPSLLTPHPAEAARLLGISTTEVQADRLRAATSLARRYRAHVVLKGVGSLVASPDGSWAVNTTGNPGLASGGTGDVLAGLIGALLCQRLEPGHALQYAVCLHGAAADALVGRGVGPVGLTASEIALEARTVMNAWTGRVAR